MRRILYVLPVVVLLGCSSSSDNTPNPDSGAEVGSGTGDSGGQGDAGGQAGGDAGGPGDAAGQGGDTGGGQGEDASQGGDTGSPVPEAAPFDGNVPDAVPGDYTGTPFGGTAQTIPGTIELARYDVGGEGVAFHDTSMPPKAFSQCGLTRSDGVNLVCTNGADDAFPACTAEPAGEVYLGYLGNAEWFNYTVNVGEAGTYVISGHIATASATTKVSFSFSPTVTTGSVTLPSDVGCGGHEAYHNWSTSDNLATIALMPGRYVMTMTIVNQGLNLDTFTFTLQ